MTKITTTSQYQQGVMANRTDPDYFFWTTQGSAWLLRLEGKDMDLKGQQLMLAPESEYP
jgi:hypothetical protein